MNEVCRICEDKYKDEDIKVTYHVTYDPEVVTYSCRGCNYAEYLIRHPEVETTYFMEKRNRFYSGWSEITSEISPTVLSSCGSSTSFNLGSSFVELIPK